MSIETTSSQTRSFQPSLKPHVTGHELALVSAIFLLLGFAVFGPSMTQPSVFHHFANQSAWLGIEHAADVLSNLPFGLGALWGFWILNQASTQAGTLSQREHVRHTCMVVFFCGLLATSIGSSWYHLQPDNTGLAVDRLTMAIAFAGLLGVAACERVSPRSGLLLVAVTIIAGPISLWYWSLSGNLLPWGVVQFGGMALLIALSFVRPQGKAVSLVWIVTIYGLAKICEHFDHQIFELSAHWVSGHTLKHLVASLVIFVVINALAPFSRSPQSKP
jgi:hypothetical protein